MNFFELDLSAYAAAMPAAYATEFPLVSTEWAPRVTSWAVTSALNFGIFHGILFSLPFSTSIFISLRSFFLEGFQKGCFAFAGSLLGQLSFLYLIFFGWRPLIQGWYSLEPFLVFLGVALSFKLTTEFFHQKIFESAGANVVARTLSTQSGQIATEWTTTKGPATRSTALHALSFGSVLRPFITGFVNLWSSLRAKITVIPKIFFFQFFLIFLNPVFPGTVSRIILGQDSFDIFGQGQSSLGAGSPYSGVTEVQSLLIYSISFITTCSLSVFFLYNFLRILSIGVDAVWRGLGATWTFGRYERKAGRASSDDPTGAIAGVLKTRTWTDWSLWPAGLHSQRDANFLNKIFIFLIIGTLLQGSVLYSWRLFIQYPIEFFGTSEIRTAGGSALAGPSVATIRREFPTMDSSIRHREKNLPMDRYIPVERVNSRRILNGKPGLSEEQKSDAYVKYNSFFLNQMDQSFENFKIRLRQSNWAKPFMTKGSPSNLDLRSLWRAGPNPMGAEQSTTRGSAWRASTMPYDEIFHLQIMKKRYLDSTAAALPSMTMTKGPARAEPPVGPGGSTISREAWRSTIMAKSPIESNVTKGKPKLSYIQELLDSQVGVGPLLEGGTPQSNSYLHDDLQIYSSIFRIASPAGQSVSPLGAARE